MKNWRIKNRTVISYGGETNGTTNAENEEFGRYAAFPSPPVRIPNGALGIAYHRATGHNDAKGKAVFNWSDDDGRTWQNVINEVTIYQSPDPRDTVTSPQLTALPEGLMLCLLTVKNLDTSVRKVKCFLSWTNGLSWVGPVDTVDVGTVWTVNGGPAVPRPDGSIIAPIYYRNVGENRYSCAIIQSNDRGMTWEYSHTFLQDVTINGLQYEEPYLDYLEGDKMMCLVRTDLPRQIWRIMSSYHGNPGTWDAPTVAFSGYGWPAWAKSLNGQIVACTRKDTVNYKDSYGVYRVSLDGGQTFGAENVLPDPWFELGTYVYAGVGNLSPDRIGIVHAQDWLTVASGTRSRLEFCEVVAEWAQASEIVDTVGWWAIEDVLSTVPNQSGVTQITQWPARVGPSLVTMPGLNNFRLDWGGSPGGFNGLPVLEKAGTGWTGMQMATMFSTPIPQPYTVTIVCHCSYSGTGDLALWDGGDTTVAGKRDGFGHLYLKAPTLLRAPAPSQWPSGPCVFTFGFDGANSYIRRNNITLVTGQCGANNLSHFRLNGPQGIVYDVREVVIHKSTLAQATILDIHLMEKHGITG